MITKFIDREFELEALERRYKQKGFQFIPIYGRRRIGKTELILHFINNKKSIYFLATAGSKKENIENFKEAAKNVIDLSFIADDWKSIFEYIAKNARERIVIAIDEFPYLLEAERGLSSIFQYIIDRYLQNTNIFLILCGSSLGMMYRDVLNYKAPLYGRRTGQLEIAPLRFKDVVKFFENKSIEEIIKIYSICDGIPAYLKEFTEDKNLFRLMREKVLERDAVLREEVPFLLRQEFRDPKTYMSILSAISLGHRSLGKIINYCGFSNKPGIMPYLYTLEYLKYIRREVPITETLRSKKGLYFIRDNFFDFWFKFVRKNLSLIDVDIHAAICEIKKTFNAHVGFVFEKVCREFLIESKIFGFTNIGRWWHKDKEIDIVGLNDQTKQILFAECKWQEKLNPKPILESLTEKSRYVQWHNENRREYFAIFAKSFSKKPEDFEGRPVFCFDLRDLERILRERFINK